MWLERKEEFLLILSVSHSRSGSDRQPVQHREPQKVGVHLRPTLCPAGLQLSLASFLVSCWGTSFGRAAALVVRVVGPQRIVQRCRFVLLPGPMEGCVQGLLSLTRWLGPVGFSSAQDETGLPMYTLERNSSAPSLSVECFLKI